MDGIFFNRLENLPVPSSHGCLAALDENRLFFAGGRRNNDILLQNAAIYRRLAQYTTLETAYKVAICPKGNLPYQQIYFINDPKVTLKWCIGG